LSNQSTKASEKSLLAEVSPALRTYIETNIFPEYSKNDWGHRIDHIQYVIRRSFQFAATLPADQKVNPDLLYAAAAYHDLGHHIDAKHHEKVSAQMFLENSDLKQFFSDDERKTIAEAIEGHRSHFDSPQRNIYSKLIASADCHINVNVVLHRTFSYRVRNYNELSLDEIIDESRQHLISKYGYEGYALDKMSFDDPEFESALNGLRELVYNEKLFRERFIAVNHLARSIKLERELATYLESVDPKLRRYIETEIFPEYSQNDRAHGILHVREVIRRSFSLNQTFSLRLNPNIIYAAAAYHDLDKHLDSDHYETISAKLFRQDEGIIRFFSSDERNSIAEAIEDHHSSKPDHPRSAYGKLLSSANRNTRTEMVFVRSFFAGKDRQPDTTVTDFLKSTRQRLKERYREEDPEKMFYADDEYRNFLTEICQLLDDKAAFAKRYCEVNQITSREHTLAEEPGVEISPVILI